MSELNERPSPAQLLDFSGVVVAVTGASGGIGAGIARRFAAAGASLVLHYRSGEAAATALAGTLPVPAVVVGADLTAPDGGQRVLGAAVERFGGLDVLVNNAGIQPVRDLEVMTRNEWQDMLDADVSAVHFLTHVTARHMIERGRAGAIVHIASIEGIHPAPGHGHYATAKAALIMHARAAALEYGRHGIRVNSVSPGLIDRPGLDESWPEGVARWRAAAPLVRLGSPEDVGDACVFLASPLAQWITGANVVVDGGVTARPTW